MRVADPNDVRATVSLAQPWSGSADKEHIFGQLDPQGKWAGWVYAHDADTGKALWHYKTPAPILSGVTPTAGGIVFVGDMAGTFYALDAKAGTVVWSTPTGGAIGGGVISYESDGHQRVAVASGMVSPIWPVDKANAKIVVYGLE